MTEISPTTPSLFLSFPPGVNSRLKGPKLKRIMSFDQQGSFVASQHPMASTFSQYARLILNAAYVSVSFAMRTHYLLFLLLGHSASARNDIAPAKEFYTAVRAVDPFVIDGDLSEWPDANVITNPKFYIPKESGSDPNLGGELVDFQAWSNGDRMGLEDHASEFRVVYNDDNVYLGIVVTEEYHENAANSAWNGDSIQLMIADIIFRRIKSRSTTMR